VNSVAILGAGLTGAWLAYLLATRGMDVVVYDDFSQPFRASDHNPGGINPLHGPGIPGEMEQFQLACHSYHFEHANRIQELSGIDYRLRVIDRLFVAFNGEEVAKLRQMQGLYDMSPGFEARWLEADQVCALEPRVSGSVVGGLLTRGNAVVDSRLYGQALLAAAVRLGARHEKSTPRTLVRDAGRITHIEVNGLRKPCETLVIANGCWAGDFFEQLGFPVAVSPIKGQMLVVRVAGKPFPWDITRGLTGLYQYRDDLYWLGGTREDPALEPGVTEAGRRHVLDNISTMLPGVELEVVAHEAGYRPASPDGLPMVGSLPGYDNVFSATGSGSKGVLLCAGIAVALADEMQGHSSGQYNFLSLQRFASA